MRYLITSLACLMCVNAFGQNVDIPDVAFKASLVGNSAININGDDEIQISEAVAFGGEIFCDNLSISDLTGIEAFTALESLRCYTNQLTSLDVTQNTSLEFLWCSGNQLTSLDVTQNTSLESLQCTLNPLTSLDVTQNTSLEFLQCYGNQLTSLDVTQNTSLEVLWCSGNPLTSLDVSQNTSLVSLSFSYSQLTSLDVTQNTSLEFLYCFNNPLTSLDVSQNTALTGLECNTNLLTSLDLSNNTALTYLICSSNLLTSLDLSNNTALGYFACGNNQLTCLNFANGNNLSMVDLFFGNNPNLFCIEVDDAAYMTNNWQNHSNSFDAQMSFSTDCNNACSLSVGINQLSNTPKQLTKVVDLMGREVNQTTNQILFHIYDDGSVEKKFVVE